MVAQPPSPPKPSEALFNSRHPILCSGVDLVPCYKEEGRHASYVIRHEPGKDAADLETHGVFPIFSTLAFGRISEWTVQSSVRTSLGQDPLRLVGVHLEPIYVGVHRRILHKDEFWLLKVALEHSCRYPKPACGFLSSLPGKLE